MVKLFKGFGKLGKPLAIIFGGLAMPFYWLYKFILRYPFLLGYQALRKTKKFLTALVSFKNSGSFKSAGKYAPLITMVIVGLGIVVSNLNAQDIRPDNFGRGNILYKITSISENFFNDELGEEMEEGPLTTSGSPTSYLEGEVITEEKTTTQKPDEGITTLISTTQDESALISPEITDPEAVVKKRDKIIDYVVQGGDTISTIAAKFGVTTNTILWENSLSYYSTIRPGQTLKILPVSGISHKVKKGDTLKSIANGYKADINKIIDFNKLASSQDIQVNQVVIVPEGVKKTVAPAQSHSLSDIFALPAAVSSSKLQWPTNSYRITQYYSWRHSGLDIGNNTGQPIYAAETGKVEASGWNSGGYGYYIIINHGGGLKTLYGHLSKILVKNGQNLSRGSVIGAIGSTGRSTGPHLHFEIRVNGIRVNPLGYVR